MNAGHGLYGSAHPLFWARLDVPFRPKEWWCNSSYISAKAGNREWDIDPSWWPFFFSFLLFFPVVAPVLCVVLVATYPPFGVTTILALPAEAILPFKEKKKREKSNSWVQKGSLERAGSHIIPAQCIAKSDRVSIQKLPLKKKEKNKKKKRWVDICVLDDDENSLFHGVQRSHNFTVDPCAFCVLMSCPPFFGTFLQFKKFFFSFYVRVVWK